MVTFSSESGSNHGREIRRQTLRQAKAAVGVVENANSVNRRIGAGRGLGVETTDS